MDAQVRDNDEKNRFEIDLGDGLAIADYKRLVNRIMFTHTEVPPAYEGQGIARQLILAGLEAARREGRKVIPVCPLFASYMKRHPETHDLLDPAYLSVLGIERSA
ncbi:MAG TPA: GNAT family N-acetyltransferase [Sphingomonas sp.]|nr:GNAT family N-acetyltransferase [Sphingomonas sp.]